MAALTMTDLRIVRLVADVDTPAAYTQFDGVLVFVDPSLVQPLPQRTTPDGLMYGIRGYARIGTDGTTEWVMTDAIDNATKTQLRQIPGVGGWTNIPARNVYLQAAIALVNLGVPPATVVNTLTALYNAAVTNHG